MQGHTNYTANAVEDLRCEVIESEERAEARERRAERAREEREQDAASRAMNAKLDAIRRDPKFPELGATRAEAKAICENERGFWVDQTDRIGCKIGGVVIFACEIEAREMSKCTHYVEGADLAETKRQMIDDHGQPESQAVSEAGFHVYTWESGTIVVTGYPRGVQITHAKADDQQ